MSEKATKTPQIRFDGYTDAWEQRKLGDVFDERSERASGNEELLSVTISNGVIRQIDSEKRNIASEDKSNYKVVKKGDVPYNSMRMWQGAVGTSDYDGIVSPAYTVLIPKNNCNGKFFMELFKKQPTLEIFKRWSQGLTSDTWNLKYPVLSTIPFMIPSVKEQEKIGDYFSSLDSLITLHQRECDLLAKMKKSYLQKMFPKNGEDKPEIRFDGYTDAWEERKFADFIDVKSGKDYKHLNSGSIPVYGTGGYMLSVDRALSDIDAIGIGRKGTIDKPYLLKAPFWTVDTLFYAVPKQNIDLQFSLSIFKKINWKKFDESTGVPSLSKTVINSVSVSVPSYEEQQKIGSFFKQLDDTIALHQRELDSLKKMKKSLLQMMFV